MLEGVCIYWMIDEGVSFSWVYETWSSKIFLRADKELDWLRAMVVCVPLTSLRAHLTMVWDTVLVKRTRRSGLPICLNPEFFLTQTLA